MNHTFREVFEHFEDYLDNSSRPEFNYMKTKDSLRTFNDSSEIVRVVYLKKDWISTPNLELCKSKQIFVAVVNQKKHPDAPKTFFGEFLDKFIQFLNNSQIAVYTDSLDVERSIKNKNINTIDKMLFNEIVKLHTQ